MKGQKRMVGCVPGGGGGDCCSVSAVVGVDERGQIVLPKELRDKAKIKAGDKLAVVALSGEKGSCCFMLMKVEELDRMVKIKVDSVLGKGKEA
ncbi:MAG TPA: HgcAB-associated protein [bacterium]